MIPAPTPALTRFTVLVTRPAEQNALLCQRIESMGGAAIPLPAVVIEPLVEPVLVSTDPRIGPHPYDVIIFVSQNAVLHGLKAVPLTPAARVAAIGKSTAAALAAAGIKPSIVPERGFTSEALLEHDGLQAGAAQRVLIVRGGAGREILEDTLAARGFEVDCLEVYRRIAAQPSAATTADVEARWAETGIDMVTLTSGEILHNLNAMLTDDGRKLFKATPLLVVSPRLGTAARALGCQGEILVAPAADDDTLTGVMATWHTRSRQP